MKIVLLGTLISNETTNLFMNKGVSPQPADIAQKYIISGLSNNQYVDEIYAICSPRIPSYPRCDIKYVSNDTFNYKNAIVNVIGYKNNSFNIVERKRNLVAFCKKFDRINDVELLIIYSLNSAFLKAAKILKKRNPRLKIIQFVPDLPLYMSKYNCFLKFLKLIDGISINHIRRKIVDIYALYSRHMADYLKIKDEKAIVIEGFVDEEKVNKDILAKTNDVKICTYAGSLDAQYGIQTLIDAFKYVKTNSVLHLFGNPLLISNFNLNERVLFKGMLSPEDVFKEMKTSDLLINPRPSALPLSKYSFPSKTFEYMSSGTPVLMTKLPCLSNEYFDYMFFIDDETPEGIARSIDNVFSTKNYYQKGADAANFLLTNKNASKQMEKLINFYKKGKDL